MKGGRQEEAAVGKNVGNRAGSLLIPIPRACFPPFSGSLKSLERVVVSRRSTPSERIY